MGGIAATREIIPARITRPLGLPQATVSRTRPRTSLILRKIAGVQHRGDADLRAQVLRIGRDGEHGLAVRFEQGVVDDGLVLVGDVADLARDRMRSS